ncbi:hypothetical protein P8452_13805 [Trifolium repens]|nr:hypothetical protein P8452_13805 [Trifolium repens]
MNQFKVFYQKVITQVILESFELVQDTMISRQAVCLLGFVVGSAAHLSFPFQSKVSFQDVDMVASGVTTAFLVVVVGGSYGGSSIHGYQGVRSTFTPAPSSFLS